MITETKYTWIIGASEGIGEALAISLAKKSEVLCLSARNEERLRKVCDSLEGEDHFILPFDVSHKDKIKQCVNVVHEKFPRIDRILFMVGLYTPWSFSEIELTEADKIVDVNFASLIHLVGHILPILKDQNNGQIAICGSVAGYAGLPNSQPYGATKAAVINFTESLRAELEGTLDIKLINPGFVKTRLTDKNDFDMPFRISAEDAGEIIAKELDSKKFEIHFPKKFTYLMKVITNFPYWLYFKFTKNISR